MKLIFIFFAFFCLSAKFVGSDKPTFKTTKYNQEFKTGLIVPKDLGNCKIVQKSCKKPSAPKMYEGELPKKFDWRNYGISPIRNQGSCGSCWSFSMTSVLEDNIYLRNISKDDLSEQFLVGHDFNASGCRGGWMKFHMFKGNSRYPGGTMLESDCPYSARSRRCSNYSKSKLKYKILDWHYVDESSGVPNPEKLKRAIYSYGPISVAVSASGSFSSYSSGIYNSGSSGRINHAVNLVGWDDTVEPKHWIMRNSWGTAFGEDGYMRIAYGSKKIGYGATYIDYDGTIINKDDGPGPDGTDYLTWILLGVVFITAVAICLIPLFRKKKK